jgi:DNA polymerase-3 subunit gamma/tau
MALIRLGRLEDLVSLNHLAQLLSQGQATAPGSNRVATPAGSRPVAPPEGAKKKYPIAPGRESGEGAASLTEQSLPQIWTEVLAQVGVLFASDLEKAGLPAISGPNTLVLRFPARYNRERDICQEPTRLQRIEQALQKVTQRPWKVRVETGSAGAIVEPPAGTEPRETLSTTARARLNKEQAESVPLVKRALEVLGAQLIRADEGFGATAQPAERLASEPEPQET